MSASFGSTAMRMTYGEYLRMYPKGYTENADLWEQGYCILDNQNRKNVCWITDKMFTLIQEGTRLCIGRETRKAKGNLLRKAVKKRS